MTHGIEDGGGDELRERIESHELEDGERRHQSTATLSGWGRERGNEVRTLSLFSLSLPTSLPPSLPLLPSRGGGGERREKERKRGGGERRGETKTECSLEQFRNTGDVGGLGGER